MPQDLIPQINNRVNRQVNAENLMQGIRMFNIGLLKKALLADTFSKVVYLDRQIAAERYVIQLILPCDNIRLFSFSNETDITMDLNNYKDTIHYGEWTNSLLLKHMNNDYGRLTSDNYEEYLRTEKLLYSNFDYNSLFKQMG